MSSWRKAGVRRRGRGWFDCGESEEEKSDENEKGTNGNSGLSS